MLLLIVAGIGILVIVATACVWAVVVLLAKVVDEQDAGADSPESGKELTRACCHVP